MSKPRSPRRAPRNAVVMSATCRTQSGLRDKCDISDISAHGCRLTTSTLVVRIGGRVLIRPQGMESLSGVIRWIEGQVSGIEFDAPLYGPVVEHLSAIHAAGESIDVSSC